MGDAWNLFEGDSNPLYDVYYVRAKTPEDTKDIAKQAAKFPSVFKADYGGVNSDKIFKIIKPFELGKAAAAFLFVAVFLISNTIRITIFISSKRNPNYASCEEPKTVSFVGRSS